MSGNKKEESEKELRIPLEHPWRVFGFEVIFFAVSLGLGILSAQRLNNIFEAQKVSPLPPVSIWQFLTSFTLATLLLLLFIYFFKFQKAKGVILRVIFFLVIGISNLFFFGMWLPALPCLVLVFTLLFLWVKTPSLLLHNLILIFAIAGIGSSLGLRLHPEAVVFLLIVFSLYDYLAVYKTKHMVKIAKEMLSHKALLGFVLPQEISSFKAPLTVVQPGGKFLVLGAGDIVFPLLLAASLVPQGILSSLVVAVFSLLGVLVGFLIFISQKSRAPMPALPPIALFSIIGFLLTKIF